MPFKTFCRVIFFILTSIKYSFDAWTLNFSTIFNEIKKCWVIPFFQQDSAHKTRNDYERCVDNYSVAKAKYEEQYGKGKIGRRLDDCRDRYQKACRLVDITFFNKLQRTKNYKQFFSCSIWPNLQKNEEHCRMIILKAYFCIKLKCLFEKIVPRFRKLHQTHNEYVLLISEAAEFERDMRTILLPGKIKFILLKKFLKM